MERNVIEVNKEYHAIMNSLYSQLITIDEYLRTTKGKLFSKNDKVTLSFELNQKVYDFDEINNLTFNKSDIDQLFMDKKSQILLKIQQEKDNFLNSYIEEKTVPNSLDKTPKNFLDELPHSLDEN